MPRKGENIYKRKDGRWEARYIKSRTPEGKALYGYIYAKSYADVKLKQSIAVSNSQEKISNEVVKYKFFEIAEKWLSDIKLRCKITTYNKYRNTYKN